MTPCQRIDHAVFLGLIKGSAFFLNGKEYRKTGFFTAKRTTPVRPKAIRVFPLRIVQVRPPTAAAFVPEVIPHAEWETAGGTTPEQNEARFAKPNDGQTHFVGDNCPGGHEEVK